MRTWPALALLVLGLASSAFGAGDQTQILSDERIEVRVGSPWPNYLSRGMVPIFVDITNDGDRGQRLFIRANCNEWNNRRTIDQGIEIGAGQRVHLELLAPVASAWDSQYSLQVRVIGSSHALHFGNVGSGGASGEHSTVLAVGAREVAESVVQRWTEETSISTVNSGWTPPGTTATNDNMQVGYARFEQLPANSAAYTSVDTVVLDTDDALPTQAALDALLGWVRNGGTLVLSGARAPEVARGHASFAAWMEPRFRRTSGAAELYAFGLGRLVIATERDFFDNPAVRELVRVLGSDEGILLPNQQGGSRLTSPNPMIPGVGQVPYQIFALLLILFAIVIGPVNFVLVRRLRRSALLLITIPTIACFTSAALLAYGIFVQGLDVKTASLSMACLDQREHRVAVLEKRMLFAGMAPSDGLRPGPGTSVHAGASALTAFFATRDRLDLRIERSEGNLLSGDYLPTRAAVVQILCTERAERARLDVEARDGAYEITNNLGTPIEHLVLRDRAGDYFATSVSVSPGARAQLAPLELDRAVMGSIELLRDPISASPTLLSLQHGIEPGHALPTACFAARIGPSPFRDDCGVPSNEIVGQHGLYGVLPLDLEAWQ